MHFVMYAFSNHVRVLHNVTPFVQLQQTAVLFDGVVVARLHNQYHLFIFRKFNNASGWGCAERFLHGIHGWGMA